MNALKGRHYYQEIILLAVRCYCKYGKSYRELEEMLAERGVQVDHCSIYRWVQRYTPEIENLLRWYWRNVQGFVSWRLDETYIKVAGKWAYSYSALDKHENTIDFYISPCRNTKIAQRFLGKTLRGLKQWQFPSVINTDIVQTYSKAITQHVQLNKCPQDLIHRLVKYLNNIIECDHGKLKRIINSMQALKP